MADKHNIPKGKMYSNFRLLSEDIVCKITQRNHKRRAITCDPVLKLLNGEITSDIQKHKQNIWKEHLDAHWDHRHILWKTIHGENTIINNKTEFSIKIVTNSHFLNKLCHVTINVLIDIKLSSCCASEFIPYTYLNYNHVSFIGIIFFSLDIKKNLLRKNIGWSKFI